MTEKKKEMEEEKKVTEDENTEDKCNKSSEEEAEKCNDSEKPKEGVLNKSEDEDDEEMKALDESEREEYKRMRKKIREARKSAGLGENPEQAAAASNTDQHTTSPGAGTPSGHQDVFVPSSDVDGKREQSTPMGKSLDLQWKELNKQVDGMKDAFSKKLEAIEKSTLDRIENLEKTLRETEEGLKKFYSQPLYKAASEEVGPEGVIADSIPNQIRKGAARFRNK